MAINLPPWLHDQAERLSGLFNTGRLPHAILLAGPPGWGQALLARWLANHLLELGGEQDAADVAHPDLRWVEPDGAVIKIDQVRTLATFAVGTRQSAPCKVAVIDQAHSLNIQAANALLKTLEEPPQDTYLVLSTEYASRLIPTIRSRCQLFAVLPDLASGSSWLDCEYGSDVEALAFEYGGAPLAVAEAISRDETPLQPALVAAGQGDVALLQDTLSNAEPSSVLLRWLRYVLAELAGTGRIPGLAEVSPRALIGFQEELLFAHRQLVSSNSANHRLQLERLALRFTKLGKA